VTEPLGIGAKPREPWPIPTARQRLTAASIDVAVVLLIASPLLVAAFLHLQVDLREGKRACEYGAGGPLVECLHDVHIDRVTTFAMIALFTIAGVGIVYFGSLQSNARRMTLGEWVGGVRVVRHWPRRPLTRPTMQAPLCRFLVGLGLCLPISVVGVQLWIDPRMGVPLLIVATLIVVACARPIYRGLLRPERGTGAMAWDRWTSTIVVAYGAPRFGLGRAAMPGEAPEQLT
jgi:RDD family